MRSQAGRAANAGGAALRRALIAIVVAWAALAPRAGGGEDVRSVSLVAERMPSSELLAAVGDLAGGEYELDTAELAAGAAERPATLALVDASPAGARQAVAHALGLRWAASDGRVRFGAVERPSGRVVVRIHPSASRDDAALDGAARQLLAPWLALPDAGLAYLSEDGRWYATLPASGHERLMTLLTLVEAGAASWPARVPDAEVPDPRRRLAGDVAARGWRAFALALARSARLSVALAPALAEAPIGDAALTLPACTIGELPARLGALGAQAALLHGVLCLDRQAPGEREAAWSRARLALLPIAHLARDEDEAGLLAADLALRVTPAAWREPGCGIIALPSRRLLLACGDPGALGALFDALEQIDLLGIDAGLASLGDAAPPAGERAPAPQIPAGAAGATNAAAAR